VALANLDVQKEASRLALAVVPRGLSLADLGPRGRALAAVPRGPKTVPRGQALAAVPRGLSLADHVPRGQALAAGDARDPRGRASHTFPFQRCAWWHGQVSERVLSLHSERPFPPRFRPTPWVEVRQGW